MSSLFTGIEVKLVVANLDDDKSQFLFARLSSDVVDALLCNVSNSLDRTQNDSNQRIGRVGRACWSLDQAGADFLPLEFNFSGKKHYASFNGGLLDEQVSHTCQVSAALLAKFQHIPDVVELRIPPRVFYATHIQVDPIAVEDWEFLQVHAGVFETGGFLEQVSLVYLEQHVILRLGQDTICMVVKNIGIDCGDSPWPSTPREDVIPFALLAKDTEVIISPKPRASQPQKEWSQPLRLMPCRADTPSHTLLLGKRIGKSSVPDVSPNHILVHPDVLDLVPADWIRLSPDGKTDNSIILQMMTSKDVSKSHIFVHPWIRLELGLSLYWSEVQLCPTIAPRVVELDCVSLEPLNIEFETLHPWLQPDISMRCHNEASPVLENLGECTLRIGSIIPSSKSQSGMARITTISSSEWYTNDMVVVAAWTDFVNLKVQIDESSQNDRLQTCTISGTDQTFHMAPELILDSTLATVKSFLERFQNGSSIAAFHGACGSGKTHLSLTVATAAQIVYNSAVIYIDCGKLQETKAAIGEILTEMETTFRKAVEARRSVIVLDNLDRIAPNAEGGEVDEASTRSASVNPISIAQSKLVSDQVVHLITSSNIEAFVSVIYTCKERTSIHRSLSHGVDFTAVPALRPKERSQMLMHLLQPHVFSCSTEDYSIDSRTEGFRPRDVEKVATRASHLLQERNNSSRTIQASVDLILQNYKPLSHLWLNETKPDNFMRWADIGGLFEAKRMLESTLLHPIKYRAIYNQAKIKLPRGALLLGPTGCGKTTLIPAIAEECNFSLISCKGPEILDKYIGSSEAKVRELFNRAAAVAPSILFLDELDALAPRRGSDHTGVTDRVVNQLLTFLDGVEVTKGGEVYVIGASSRPDKIDPALLRPGRLEQHVYVGPPETGKEWADLFWKIAAGWDLSSACTDFLSSEQEIIKLLRVISTYSCFCAADLKASMQTAHLKAVHRLLGEGNQKLDNVEIEIEDLKIALGETKPCLSGDDAAELEKIYMNFRGKGRANQSDKSKELRTALR